MREQSSGKQSKTEELPLFFTDPEKKRGSMKKPEAFSEL